MARKLRLEYEGAIYHVINRGDRGEAIFKDDQDYEYFIETLGEVCKKTDWQVHAFCLMKNHFHLVIETPNANLVVGMKWFLGTYTARFNRRHKVYGHLFSGRYKSLIVDGSGSHYLRTVCHYVHLNPTRAKLLKANEPLSSYRWSSLPLLIRPPSKRPQWIRMDRVFGDLGIPKDSTAGRRQFERIMEDRRQSPEADDYKPIERGWYVGDQAFRKELLEQMFGKFGAHHYGPERAESGEQKAEHIVKEELAQLGWDETVLKTTRKGDVRKIKIAHRLRKDTTMSLQWIAHHLEMGSPNYINNRLYLFRKGLL